MSLHRVRLTRTILQVATVVIEAQDALKAKAKAERELEAGRLEPEWHAPFRGVVGSPEVESVEKVVRGVRW